MSNTVKFRKRQYKILIKMHMRHFRKTCKKIGRLLIDKRQRLEEEAQANEESCKGGVDNE